MFQKILYEYISPWLDLAYIRPLRPENLHQNTDIFPQNVEGSDPETIPM